MLRVGGCIIVRTYPSVPFHILTQLDLPYMVPQEQLSPEITSVLFLHYMQCSTTFPSLF
jgi:hypothetical protein